MLSTRSSVLNCGTTPISRRAWAGCRTKSMPAMQTRPLVGSAPKDADVGAGRLLPALYLQLRSSSPKKDIDLDANSLYIQCCHS